jgi:phosphoenolpyruvate carboxylase
MMNETEKDLPLRHDLARLDRLLAEIVREQEGEAVTILSNYIRKAP